VKSRCEIEAKTLEDRNTTDEREATGAIGQPKHALEALRSKMLELMDEAGLTAQVIIEKYLAPKLYAKTTKLAIDDGKFTDFVDLEDHGTQMQAIDTMLKMHGAYAPKDPKEAAQFGVKVVIIDVPRPQHGVYMPDVGPGDPLPPLPSNGSNGHKAQE
jgi:hypothetical protein